VLLYRKIYTDDYFLYSTNFLNSMKTLLRTTMSPASVKPCLFEDNIVLNKEISTNFNIVSPLNEISALSKLVGILLLSWGGAGQAGQAEAV